MERKELSLRPRIGLVGCNWKPARKRTVDTIRCARVQEQVPGQNELPVRVHCGEVEMAQVPTLGRSVPSGRPAGHSFGWAPDVKRLVAKRSTRRVGTEPRSLEPLPGQSRLAGPTAVVDGQRLPIARV